MSPGGGLGELASGQAVATASAAGRYWALALRPDNTRAEVVGPFYSEQAARDVATSLRKRAEASGFPPTLRYGYASELSAGAAVRLV